MAHSLVIVESPAKCKTLERYLGKDFKILASYGHVRDLLPKTGAVEPENNFAMHYEVIEKNTKALNSIVTALKKADRLYLATDPDREGEAISWHLYELLKERGCLKDKKYHRIVFYEVTKKAVQAALEYPRELSSSLVNSQQARRALDYLVGFNLSPLLWKKVQTGLSAGRVQSPALRMIVEREEEIQAFKAKEYWTIEAELEHHEKKFQGKLIQFKAEKIKQFTITNTAQAETIKTALQKTAQGMLVVASVTKKQRKRRPAPPFMTSTLQQEAANKLGFTVRHTMRVAQQLYEGIDVGDGEVGLITYMRTDSVTLSQEALNQIREFIGSHYKQPLLPSTARIFKTNSKNAQEAHEAIRPTSITRMPVQLKHKLTVDQCRLYELIWKRTVASQMIDATIDTVTAELACGVDNLFRATGSVIAAMGFMQVYSEDVEHAKHKHEENMLPELKEGEQVKLIAIRSEQHFTEPPPRYSEASLVKSLENYGIGRPSTYASIILTLQSRKYVELEKKRFHPTDIGKIVNNFLINHFTDYVDYDFTAKLENDLDAIARGEKDWLPLMKNFWGAFHKQILDKDKNVSRSDVAQQRILGIDPKSGKEVSVRIGRYGPYVQIGTKDDETKPKFASLRPGQKLDTITFEDALQLFILPRHLGKNKQQEDIVASLGRYGPYIRYGSKFVSLKKEDDPYTVNLERALALIAEKEELDAKKQIKFFEKEGISILNGSYGPYVTDGSKNVKVPKDKEPAKLTLEEAIALLQKKSFTRSKKRTAKKSSVKKIAKKSS